MKVFKRLSVVLLMLAACMSSAFAQNREISGTVTDPSGQPVISAAVLVSGTTTGVVTDLDGRFAIKVPQTDVVLEVSGLGYIATTVAVPASQNVVNVVIEEESTLLTETVVVGYGSQKKVNLTGAVTAIDSKELQDRTAHSVTNMLQGSVPGLNISTSAGNPGATASMNIRGVTSINGGSPLVLIDGAIGDLDRVNPNDIESISVIKDAGAAAVYGARGAYGVILVTTKSGGSKDGNAVVKLSARYGWEEPTTSTEYEDRGYWSVYTTNLFWQPTKNAKYIDYDEHDMMELLARVNDKTENPDRPWVVEDTYKGKKVWKYYANTDYWHELFVDQHPVQQYNVSVTGGDKNVKYFVSAGYDKETGIMKTRPDVFQKYNIRAKVDFKMNKYMNLSNNTAFYNSGYEFQGVGNVENVIAYGARHFLANFTTKNPDGSWVYATPYLSSYRVGNGRHIVTGNDHNFNNQLKTDFSNTTQLVVKPVKSFWWTSNVTYRFRQNRNTYRTTNFDYRVNPGDPLSYYTTGAGLDELKESFGTYNYLSGNSFVTYDESFGSHHITATAGMNYEQTGYKYVAASGENILSEDLNDLSLVGPNAAGDIITTVDGSQSENALLGFFGRINYNYDERYLLEISGRYDGSSRFLKGHRWGFFPSVSAGWRISEEPFFEPFKGTVNNLKLRASFGSLGNQNVNDYIAIRTVNSETLKYSFGDSSVLPKYTGLSTPNASDLTWETSEQWNAGIDINMFNNRLQATVEGYIRDTKNMLTKGKKLPGVYGATEPKMNAADLRTSGYEISISWRDQIKLAGKPFGYSIKGMLSDFQSVITRFDNPNKNFSDYYEGQRIGDIWGFKIGGIFQTDEEAKAYYSAVKNEYTNTYVRDTGWGAGDLKYLDTNDDKQISIGQNNLADHGDLVNLGNSLAHLQYGLTLGFDWLGFDASVFFQGTGNHYWYPDGGSFSFWGPYSLGYCSFMPKNFLDNVWAEDNKDAYFPRPGSNTASNSKAQLGATNDRYLQNIRYLRLKNLTIGYTLPRKATKVVGLEKVRIYFTGENMAYWSPIKKHSLYVDPEAAIDRDGDYNNGFYPWQKSNMFGIDITF